MNPIELINGLNILKQIKSEMTVRVSEDILYTNVIFDTIDYDSEVCKLLLKNNWREIDDFWGYKDEY